MGNNKWTDEQLKAISLRDKRLLVTAAAGSGKTAVLTERIIRRIIDDGVNVDELLVMTFTKAAAAEMRERIRESLEKNKLYSQLALIDCAQISTMDSFCSAVVRDHSDELNIDPASRIAEEAELLLIRSDVMEEMLESYYSSASDSFIDFAENYTEGNAGKGLEDIILSVYNYALNCADPDKWYEEKMKSLSIDDECFVKITGYILKALKLRLSDQAMILEEAVDMCSNGDGPETYLDTLNEDIRMIQDIADSENYAELSRKLAGAEFGTLSRKKSTASDEAKKRVQKLRNSVKASIKTMCDRFCPADMAGEISVIAQTHEYVLTLIGMARHFGELYSIKKREKNVLDFSDLEHLALKILETGEYKGVYKEIYVDEYQDTNEVQEAIIAAMDENNVFMVGDIKQSIYSFRQARPDIFMDKQEEFVNDAERGEVVELSKNFRSRKEVLTAVNNIFAPLMSRDFGGSDYNERTKLHAAADYHDEMIPQEAVSSGEAEMFIIDMDGADPSDDNRSAEARFIAKKIKELTDPANPLYVFDKKDECYRAVRYSDIAILLRAGGASGDIFQTVLNDSGIPAHAETNKGYFDSLEIRTITAALTAIDNPFKDIALAAFLRSPMIGMDDERLAMLRAAKQGDNASVTPLYECLKLRRDEDAFARRALDIIETYAGRSAYMSMTELVTALLDETGYAAYVSALPAGKIRTANIEKLKAMAASYAQTGYKGLFNFIRYIDNLKEYDTDFGEASVLGDKDDTVRIMTIHKSKGLEFPIVFLGSVDRKFNLKDTASSILIDRDFGIAAMNVDAVLRSRRSTFMRNAIALKKETEERSEELRILYVALTRAREQLYISGCVKNADELYLGRRGIYSADNFLDFIKASCSGIKTSVIPVNTLIKDEEKAISDIENIRERLRALKLDDTARAELDSVLAFEYKFAADVSLHNKVSISKLKQREAESLEDAFTPAFAVSEANAGGAERGTLYHSILEKLDYGKILEGEDRLLLSDGSECPKAAYDDISAFVKSPLGSAFASAYKEGRLHREEQFIMGLPARQTGEADSDEPVLIQGIIDAYIDYDDGIVLVDYKTDRVKDEDELKKRYAVQLKYYAKALEMMYQKKVKEQLIYSFTLGKAVKL